MNQKSQSLWQVDIVIPVLNQLAFTRQCLESLQSHTHAAAHVIVVDNGSTDGTADYLHGFPLLKVIRNSTNLGCAVAWNQGVNAAVSDRIVILNNDVLLTPCWLDGLLAASEHGLDIVSPALREGPMNYKLEAYARDFVKATGHITRPDTAHGVCFLVRREVFNTIGLFDENFRIGQYEDADFFERAREAGFKLGATGRSFIHHFGSVTQNAFQDKKARSLYETTNRAYFRKKWGLGWRKRHWRRFKTNLQTAWWKAQERRLCGHSLNERWIHGQLLYD